MRIIATLLGIFALAGTLAAADPQFAQFTAISMNAEAITDVKVEENDIWIKRGPGYLTAPVTIKISNQNGAEYRRWFSGGLEMTFSGPRSSERFSDRVQTQAKYIEYWIEEELVLHLERQ